VNINDLAQPKGDALDLAVGDTFDGIVEHVGEWRAITGKFGTHDKLPILVNINGEPRTRWIKKGSREASVIAAAVRAAGAEALVKGGRLRGARIDDVPTDKGNPMHDFAYKYTPPTSTVGVNASDLFPD
jgi:hypothetical protein